MTQQNYKNLINPVWKRRAGYVVIWVLLMAPVSLVASYSYIKMKEQLTTLTLSRREAIASLSAATLQEKLDRVIELGKSLAGRAKFRQLAAKEDWDEAIRIIGSVPQEFPFVDQILLVDAAGIEMADAPRLTGLRGKDFSQTDWYQGVIREWKPYISTSYQKSRLPHRNVFAVAIPILADDENPVGALVIEVRLEKVLEWIKQVDVGPSGFVYVTDQKAHLVAHPRFSPQGDIVDFSSDPSIQKALKGQQGVAVDVHPVEHEERISAYTLVPKHGWALVVAQPVEVGFLDRNQALRNLSFIYGLFVLLTIVLASVIVRFIVIRRRSEEVIRNLSLTDELTGLYNRRGFLTLAEEQLKLARRTKTELVLFFADLDGLKKINDEFGHREGDQALTDISMILKKIFREGDVIARFAGDEFAVMVVSEAKVDKAFFMARLEECLHYFNSEKKRRYKLSLSVGISSFDSEKAVSIDELMALADEKLYELKRNRKIHDEKNGQPKKK